MPIKLITGLPGSGKTLSAVELLVQAANIGGRPVYAVGIDGLVDGIATPLDDPLAWEALPDGSLVVVDEAQKWFPSTRGGNTIPPIRALSEHRHRGFDFVLVTQHPSMIDPYVRRLVGEHTHVVRKFGSKVATRYRWGEVVDDVQSPTQRSRGVESVWRYPKKLFAAYKSATLHTVKRRLPWQLVALPVVLLAGLGISWWVYDFLRGLREAPAAGVDNESNGNKGNKNKVSNSSKDSNDKSITKVKYANAEEYALAHTPRIPSLPWSAPAFDERRVSAEPEVYCIIIEGAGCRCYTEQATRYHMEPRNCRTIAHDGVYNPYRRRSPERSAISRESARPGGGQAAENPRRDAQGEGEPGTEPAVATDVQYGSPSAPAVPGSAWVLGRPRPDAQ